MATFELKLPQMGESVAEATLTAWLKDVGDPIAPDETVFEIATDKVDSEVPSEVAGILLEKRFAVDDVIQVGQVVAVLQTEGEIEAVTASSTEIPAVIEAPVEAPAAALEAQMTRVAETVTSPTPNVSNAGRFYSPLVKNIAKAEGITPEALETIPGTGKEGRVTKNDIMAYLENRSTNGSPLATATRTTADGALQIPTKASSAFPTAVAAGDERIPLSRMGKLIAQHMATSVATSAHVQSFIEVDVTAVVNWRNRVKKAFEAREGEKFTFTPIFMEAVALALKKYPMLNISLEGDTIIKKKNINLGMATALPDGNLIVPVIKNADRLSLVGMAKTVNDLAHRARNSQLHPSDVKDGTYTVTNIGSFGSIFGTPIINQPQVGILAVGAIRKTPAVIETDQGEYLGIRSKMFLSHSYDHRVVNGALGGLFIKTIADYLEAWDTNRSL